VCGLNEPIQLGNIPSSVKDQSSYQDSQLISSQINAPVAVQLLAFGAGWLAEQASAVSTAVAVAFTIVARRNTLTGTTRYLDAHFASPSQKLLLLCNIARLNS